MTPLSHSLSLVQSANRQLKMTTVHRKLSVNDIELQKYMEEEFLEPDPIKIVRRKNALVLETFEE